MRSSKEIRQEAWDIVMHTTWPRKILCNGFVLYLILLGAILAIMALYEHAGIQTWDSFREAQREAQRAGLDMTVPSTAEALRMTCAGFFESFIRYIVQGIIAFGIATTLVKCARNDSKDWFASAFGGFKRPFGLLGLTMLIGIKVILWMLLLIIPGIIAAIRYRFTMYVKAENPGMGAGDCIRRSCEIMDGRKMKYVAFCLSYIGWGLLAIAPLVVAIIAFAACRDAEDDCTVFGLIGVVGVIATLAMAVFTGIYSAVGQAVFYRDAKAEVEGACGA